MLNICVKVYPVFVIALSYNCCVKHILCVCMLKGFFHNCTLI